MPDRPTDRPTSTFSKDFAKALKGYMKQRGIRQKDLVASTGRSKGFVSEHLSGVHPVDTDMVYAIARLARVDARRLTDEVTRRMDEPDELDEPTRRQSDGT